MHKLAQLLAGDPAPTHRAALLRHLGTHNSRYGERRECRVITNNGAPCDISEFADMFDLYGDRALLHYREDDDDPGNANPPPPPPLWGQAPTQNGNKPAIDVAARFAAMGYKKGGDRSIHATQLSCTASLLRAGCAVHRAVELVLEATRKAVADNKRAANWDWAEEERGIRGMCHDWIYKKPELHILLSDGLRAKWAAAVAAGKQPKILFSKGPIGWHVRGMPPKEATANPGEQEDSTQKAEQEAEAAFVKPEPVGIIVTLEDWLARPLQPPDTLLGHFLTTTSRIQLAAPTGLGKTLFLLAMFMAMSAGRDFLHWKGRRPCNVLIVDGEMPRRLVKARLVDEVRRLGERPPGFHLLSHEDVENFAPLNTPQGQLTIEQEMRKIATRTGHPVECLGFDNIMSLTAGNMKDEEAWALVLPWITDLTKRCIGQVWVHHTGHDESRAYGTKTREWRMDSCVFLEKREQSGIDVSFELSFQKARERTPDTRADFENVLVSLIGNTWTHSRQGGGSRLSRGAYRALGILEEMTIQAPTHRAGTRPAIAKDAWKNACAERGVLGIGSDSSQRSTFSRVTRELADAGKVGAQGNLVWVAPSKTYLK